MKNDPTLIILIPGFPINEEDTTCLPAQQLFIKKLNKDFPNLNLVILSFQYPFLKSVYYWNNNQVFAFGGRNKGGIKRFLLWHHVNKKLSQLKKEHDIIGLLSFWGGECTLVGHRWAKKNNLKHFTWLMGQDAKKENHYIKRTNPAREDLISISDFISEEFHQNHGVIPQHIIPLGIDPNPLPNGQNKRDIDILFAGSLIPLKQYHLCIEITLEVKKQFPGTRVMLCGKGPEEEKIRSLIRDNSLGDNISLAGEKSHSELLAMMKRSKLFLHPSSYEGFGVVCLEALAAGTPVISFCQPMKQAIEKWHIANSTADMIKTTLSILNSPPDYTPVIPYNMEDTAKKIMKLFTA